jgi:hypothetical protein
MWDIFSHQFQAGPRWTGSTRSPTRAFAQALPAIERRCRPDSADIPTRERAVRRKLLHLLRDFSQSSPERIA